MKVDLFCLCSRSQGTVLTYMLEKQSLQTAARNCCIKPATSRQSPRANKNLVEAADFFSAQPPACLSGSRCVLQRLRGLGFFCYCCWLILANQMLKKSSSASENISPIKLGVEMKIVISSRIKLQLSGISFN